MSRVISFEEDSRAGVSAPPRVVRIRQPSIESLIAGAIIGFVVVWRTWAAFQWSFERDDWLWVTWAARTPFLRFVTMQYNGHLQPAGFALVWLATRIAPLDYTLVIAPVLLFELVGGILMWRLLRALFGERPWNLVLLGVFLFCPLSMRAALWLAAGTETIPLQVFIVATLYAVLLYVRSPSPRRLAAVGGVYAAALLFWEKSLLILPLAVMFVLLFLGEGTGRNRVRRLLVDGWQLWAVLLGLTVPYAVWYRLAVTWPLTAHPGGHQVAQLARHAIGSSLLPGYLGGPWGSFAYIRNFTHRLSTLPRFGTWAAAAAVVALSVVLRRQAWRAWAMLGAYVGLDVALLALGRLSLLGPLAGLDTRYVADSVPVLALALGLAFMTPVDRRSDPAWTSRRIEVEIPGRDAAWVPRISRGGGPDQDRRTLRMSRVLALGLVTAYAISAMITSYSQAGLSAKLSSKQWLANVKTSLAAHPSAAIVDGILPIFTAPVLGFSPVDKLSVNLASISPRVRWDGPDEHPYIFDGGGDLRPVVIGRFIAAPAGPTPGCGYLVGATPTIVRLPQPAFVRKWGIALTYYTPKGHGGSIAIDGDQQHVMFLSGLHDLVLFHVGKPVQIAISSSPNAVCVTRLWIGPITAQGSP